MSRIDGFEEASPFTGSSQPVGSDRFRVLVVLELTMTAMEATSLRCGSRLVSVGDHVVEVFKHCGMPVYEEQTTLVKTER